MKKIVSVMLMLLLVFAFVSCGENEKKPEFIADFEAAIDATITADIEVVTTLDTELGKLNSTIKTVFNPNGSATITYSIDRFAEDFTSPEPIVTKTGTVTYKNGQYSDGGEFAGAVDASAVSSVNLNLDDTKMDYKIDGGTLSATVKAENVKDVLGLEIPADVSFVLTKGEGKIVSLSMSYELPEGKVSVLCTYN